jgi:hypothetical protein
MPRGMARCALLAALLLSCLAVVAQASLLDSLLHAGASDSESFGLPGVQRLLQARQQHRRLLAGGTPPHDTALIRNRRALLQQASSDQPTTSTFPGLLPNLPGLLPNLPGLLPNLPGLLPGIPGLQPPGNSPPPPSGGYGYGGYGYGNYGGYGSPAGSRRRLLAHEPEAFDDTAPLLVYEEAGAPAAVTPTVAARAAAGTAHDDAIELADGVVAAIAAIDAPLSRRTARRLLAMAAGLQAQDVAPLEPLLMEPTEQLRAPGGRALLQADGGYGNYGYGNYGSGGYGGYGSGRSLLSAMDSTLSDDDAALYAAWMAVGSPRH